MKIVNILRKIKRKINVLTGKHLIIKKTVEHCDYKWYGTVYGGFYVSTENLDKTSIVYSFGIGEDISFDREIIEKHDCSIFGFDPTPKSIHWVKKQNLPVKFNFYEYGIGNKTGLTIFYLPKNKKFISGSILKNNNVDITRKIEVTVKKFKDIAHELKHKKVDVLKMDIEGAEYDVIPDILNSNIEITQLLIEFHHRMFKNGKKLTQNAINLLKKNGFEIFAVSDSSEEVSFIKKAF